VGAAASRGCSLLFAVGAQAGRAELSASPSPRRRDSLRLAHAIAPCCAATRRLREPRSVQRRCPRLLRMLRWLPSTLAAPRLLARLPCSRRRCAACHTQRNWSGQFCSLPGAG